MPSNWHSIHKNDLARAWWLKRSGHSSRLREGNAPREPIVKILQYKDMARFFLKGESDEL